MQKQIFTTANTNPGMGVTTTKLLTILLELLYYFIAVILLFSGVSKVLDPSPMFGTMKAAFKINEELLILAVTVVPIVESALGLMLLLKVQTKKTFLATIVLFFAFFVFSVYGTAIGLNTDCGCFGDAVSSEFGITMIIRNLVLLTIIIWLAVDIKKFASTRHKIK
ncbi:MAG: methylamine utilization protein [Ignavibacteriales bacterium]|nr:methylamine utilization protein [Ignavibacteriales bacterium]